MGYHTSVLSDLWQWGVQNLTDRVNISKRFEAAKILFQKNLY